jgi:alkanesulfonate monooxygenase SsuD/methylene tetrahydromethanopterin reductase-like flavin-dependent oxidoreductase (luciferase family)
MKFGMVGSYGTLDELLEMAHESEEHGWDGFFTWDAISMGRMEIWDPWVLLAAAAERTSRIRLGALVFSLARRRPWKVVREALTLDHLSGGRVVIPVGLGVLDDAGFSRVSGEVTGLRDRAERLDDTLAILDRAWQGEPFSYQGTHHSITDAQFLPRPVQRPRIPIWPVGGWPSERSMARAARWDGVVLQRVGSDDPLVPADVADAVAWLTAHRDGGVEGYDVVVQQELPDDVGEARDLAAAFADAGATWWIESRWDPATATAERLFTLIRQGPPQL